MLDHHPPLSARDVVADRFELKYAVGSGGMAAVWRAHDRARDGVVALKVTLDQGIEGQSGSFEHEASVLRGLDHPAIVRYVAHGMTERGLGFLATEWLEGEDLAARLRRGPLGVEESLALAGRVADALTAVHEGGIVHCDLKPPNLFLIGGRLTEVKLLDFGIARRLSDEHGSLNGVVGTPYYMAPEQGFEDQNVDTPTDLYALGCVLFECLTGRPPFMASNPLAVLTKVVFEIAPAPSEIRPGLPRAIDTLIAELLAKDPSKRMGSAAEVSEEINALLASRGEEGTRVPPSALTRVERRLCSVVLAAEERIQRGSSPTDPRARSMDPNSTLSVLPRYAPPLSELHELARRYGAQLRVLRDGSIAAMLAGSGAPTDVAANAARCALALRVLLPEVNVVLVTGWQVFTGMQPLGQVIDRAAALVEERTSSASGHVVLDAMTAALLGDRFTVSGKDDALRLVGEHEPVEQVQRLLGKPSPCVGREQELCMLEGLFAECVVESASRAVLVSADPGVGKSRLCRELLRRIRSRGRAQVWIAYGDPTRQKAPFGMLAQVVRRAARLLDGEPVELRRQKLAAQVARHVDGAMQRRVAEFLGEMVATPFPAEESVQLRAARQEPMLMSDQMRRAWVDFVEAECRAHPVLLVLEDLHWGDPSTVDFVGTALRLIKNQAFMVLVFARPEITQVFPNLWAERGVTSHDLGELSQRACEGLVRATLGDAVPDAEVARLVERSARNAFFLEELLRAVAERRGEEVPDTVLAMMQSRLESLDPQARRILRAGSLFGGRFWRGAVAWLLGLPPGAPQLDQRLDELERREWILRRLAPTFHGETEYVFRHSLVREAAYGMLTDEDRTLGHRLAGAWLERAGEMNAMVLAEHFDQGREPADAARWYRAAAQQALEGNDLAAAIARVDRAIACGACGAALGEVCLIRAEAHRWQGSFGDAAQWAERALEAFSRGSESWFAALREALASLVDARDRDRVLAMADLLDELWSSHAEASGAMVTAMTWMGIRLFALSLQPRAGTFHERVCEVEERFAAEPAVHACIAMERAFREGYFTNDTSAFGELLQVAVERFERVGDIRNASQMRVNLGHVYNELGAYRENVALLSALLRDAQRLGLANIEATVRSHFGKALLGLDRIDAARAEMAQAVNAYAKRNYRRMEGTSRAHFAIILLRAGDLDQAEAEAERALELLQPLATLRPFALAVLASVLLGQGRIAAALDAGREAVASADQAEEGEALVRLVHAEVLDLSGDRDGARRAIALARDRLLSRAAKIANLSWRRSFLENVAENTRTLALAESWLEEA